MVIMKTLPSRGAQQQLFINAHHRLSERPQGTAGILMTKVAKSSKCIIHLVLCIVVCPILDSREFILWWRNVECPWRRSNCGATLDYLDSTGDFHIQTIVRAELCRTAHCIRTEQMRCFSRPREEPSQNVSSGNAVQHWLQSLMCKWFVETVRKLSLWATLVLSNHFQE